MQNVSALPVISVFRPDLSVCELEELALQLRRDVIELTWFSGTSSSHVGGELSAAEIMAVLFGKILRLDPKRPEWPDRDRFILSKGHASGVTYAAMAWRGFFEREKLWNEFNRVGGMLQEHANMELPGIEAPTGSLGMGLSNGCGMAWGARNNGKSFSTYVVLGDGECTEGQTWEAVMTAAHFKLHNLVAIVDYNKYIISGTTYQVMDLEPFSDKWRNFGWEVFSAENGNDVRDVLAAFAAVKRSDSEKPKVLIANTVKGKGISFMEQDAIHWHAGHLDAALYEQCKRELGL